MGIVIDPIELLALKKLAVVCGALGQTLRGPGRGEQLALTRVLVDVCHRAEIDNERSRLEQG